MKNKTGPPKSLSMMSRMIGAARLDEQVFRDIAEDGSAIFQALGVVILAAIASRIAFGGAGVATIMGAVIILPVWWGILSVVVYVLSVTVFRTEGGGGSWLRLARTMGYAQSPLIMRGIIILPFITGYLSQFLFTVLVVWQFAAITVAVRVALGTESTSKAAVMVGVAIVPYVLIEQFLMA